MGTTRARRRQRATFESCRTAGRYWRGADAEAPARLVAAAADFDDDRAGELNAHAASLLVTRGDIAWAIELGEPHLRSPSPRAQIHATLATTHGHRAAGRPEHALAILDAVLSAYRAVGPEAFILSHSVLSNVEVHALAEAGRFDDAEQAGIAAIATGHEADSPTSMGLALLATGWSRVLQGRPDADEMLADAERWLGQAHHTGMMRWALLARALGRAQAADVAGARLLCDQIERLGDHPARIFEATRARIDAWMAFVDGDLGAVERELVAAAGEAARVGNVTAELGCLHDLARMGRAELVVDRTRAIAATGVEGVFLAAQIDQVVALAGGDPTRLAVSVQELDDLGLGHFAADSADACARIAAGRGDSRGAATWVRRAQELRGVNGSPPVVAMRSAALHPLTAREHARLLCWLLAACPIATWPSSCSCRCARSAITSPASMRSSASTIERRWRSCCSPRRPPDSLPGGHTSLANSNSRASSAASSNGKTTRSITPSATSASNIAASSSVWAVTATLPV